MAAHNIPISLVTSAPEPDRALLIKELLATFDPKLRSFTSKDQATIANLRKGVERFAKALSTLSMEKLECFLEKLEQGIKMGEMFSLPSEDRNTLTAYRHMLLAARHFHELLLRGKPPQRLMTASPLFIKTQYIVRIAAALGRIKDFFGRAANDELVDTIKECRRTCQIVTPLTVNCEISPRLIVDLYEGHAREILEHPILKQDRIRLEEFHEFRKNFRQLLLFTRLNLMGSSSGDSIELHKRLNELSTKLGKERETFFREKGLDILGHTIREEYVEFNLELRDSICASLQSFLISLSNLKIHSNKGAPIADLDDEKYLTILSKSQSYEEAAKFNDVLLAYNIAKSALERVYRKDGLVCSFDHVRDVSVIILIEAGIADPDLHIAALLHESKVDSSTNHNGQIFGDKLAHRLSSDFLDRLFNEQVVSAIKRLISEEDIEEESDSNGDISKSGSFRSASDIVLLIKMADYLYELRSLPLDDSDYCCSFLAETMKEHVPAFTASIEQVVDETYRTGAERLRDLLVEEMIQKSSFFQEKLN